MPLAELVRENFPDPLAKAALSLNLTDEETKGALDRLRPLKTQPGRLWLLLDGYDELPQADRERLRNQLLTWLRSDQYAAARFVFSSRATGYEPIGQDFRSVQLELLTTPAQRLNLLQRWLPNLAADISASIERQPALARLAETPFLLSLIAKLEEERLTAGATGPVTRAPRSRDELYDRAVDWFLRRGWSGLGKSQEGKALPAADAGKFKVREPVVARFLLGTLAEVLAEKNADEFSEEEVILAFEQAFPKHSEAGKRYLEYWDNLTELRTELGERSGLLGCPGESLQIHASGTTGATPSNAPKPHWRWLHRSLGEFLAGESLARRGVEACLAHMRQGDRSRWVETYGHAIGRLPHLAPKPDLNPDPRERLLSNLLESSPSLLLRLLPEVEGLDPSRGLELLLTPRDPRDLRVRFGDPTPAREWDGDLLAALIQRRLLSGYDSTACATLLLQAAAPNNSHRKLQDRPFTYLGGLLYAAQKANLPLTLADFTRAAGLPSVDPQSERKRALRVPPSGDSAVFPMGGADTHLNSQDNELPFRKEVHLTPFLLSKTAVTEAQFRRLKGEAPPKGKENHPATNLTWWEAWLYCQWVGGRLPTEAEWECAARAGSTTQWPLGDTQQDLEMQAWFRGGKDKGAAQTHPVAQLQANPWGFHDLLGNALEWCQDWYGPYDGSQTHDPSGPVGGAQRVLRGGSAWSDADFCRPGRRNGGWPWDRSGNVGFRVAFPCS